MTDPLVDLTIAVHSRTRPIARAVASVLDHTDAPVRVNVVAHNIDPEIIRENLSSYADDPRLRLLHLADGIPSPAGPMNHGFASSTAPYISVMGSDDELAPGAIDSWLALARRTGAQMVLARIQLPGRGLDPYPPVRNGRRTEGLDPLKDRLAYRSAPLGLVDRSRFGELRLTEGLPSGEDLPYSLTVWFTAERLAYDLHGPAYIVHADAHDRVTSAPRPVAEDFRFLDELEGLDWFRAANRAARRAIVAKLIRIHFFDAVLVRTRTPEQLAENQAALISLIERFEQLAPGVISLLSIADRAVLDDVCSTTATPEHILSLLQARLKYPAVPTLLPRNLLMALHRQGPFRTLFAGFRVMKLGMPMRSSRGIGPIVS